MFGCRAHPQHADAQGGRSFLSAQELPNPGIVQEQNRLPPGLEEVCGQRLQGLLLGKG